MVETSAACDLLHTSSVAISDLARSTIRLAVELCGPRIWRLAYCPVVRSLLQIAGLLHTRCSPRPRPTAASVLTGPRARASRIGFGILGH